MYKQLIWDLGNACRPGGIILLQACATSLCLFCTSYESTNHEGAEPRSAEPRALHTCYYATGTPGVAGIVAHHDLDKTAISILLV